MEPPRQPFSGPLPRTLVQRADARLDAWMRGTALPFWSSQGYDHAHGGFVEHLELDGALAEVPYKRVRAQARQIYVYCHAALLGWPDGLRFAESGWDFLKAHGWHEDGGWVRRLGRAGGVLDPVIDLYDNAFVLLALAWLARATGRGDAIDWAHRTCDVIARHSTMPASPGFPNTFPPQPGWRQQNPHMHLLEAMLALAATTGDARFHAEADALVALALRHFIDPASGTIAEFFDDRWRRAPAPEGTRIEPGHQFEWVWLLWQAGALLGRDLRAPAAALFRFGTRHGVHPGTGLVVNAVSLDGGPLDPHARLWPQTEALKAHLATGAPESGAAVTCITDDLLDRYLACCPRGTWRDQFDETGQPNARIIPSSSLYHLFVAYAELRRMAQDG